MFQRVVPGTKPSSLFQKTTLEQKCVEKYNFVPLFGMDLFQKSTEQKNIPKKMYSVPSVWKGLRD
jgi:hypothetical protein